MSSVSVLMPFVPVRPEQALPYAAFVQWSSAQRLWQGQALLCEPHQTFAYAAASGFSVPTGTGVTLMPMRHPFEAGVQARSLAAMTGQSVVAGFGPGGRVFQEGLLGKPYASPLTAVREYVTTVRKLVNGEEVNLEGEYFRCEPKLMATPGPPIEVGIGVLRSGMARLTGEIADVAITWLTPAAYVADVLIPAMRAGAESAGRAVPRVAAMVPMALTGDDRDPVKLVLASNAAHLMQPHYQAMLRRAGIEVDAQDPAAAARALTAGGAFLMGNPDEIAAQITEYHDAGVDEVVVNVTGVCQVHGTKAALAELQTILAALS